MIKVGLLNIQNIDNYGANLIAYSMEQELRLLDISDMEVSTLNFCPDIRKSSSQASSVLNSFRKYGLNGSVQAVHRHLKKGKRFCMQQIRSTRLFKMIKMTIKRSNLTYITEDEDCDQKMRRQKFEKFHNEYLHLTERSDLKDRSFAEYDIIIVGSDVVWKPDRLLAKEENWAYFLLDADRCIKIAYAASLGIADNIVLDRLGKKYAEAVNGFDYISVRESSAQAYIQRILPDREVMNCIDPVFLRKPEEYLKLFSNLKLETSDYIYVYLMGDNKNAYRYAKKLAKVKLLPIIFHTNFASSDLRGQSSITDGPCEFLHRVYNARYIVTDTFHGTAFSLIFQKKFITFTRGNMSIRLEDFLSRIEMKDRLVEATTDLNLIDQTIDYSAINEKIDNWVRLSRFWLHNAIILSVKSLSG